MVELLKSFGVVFNQSAQELAILNFCLNIIVIVVIGAILYGLLQDLVDRSKK